MGDSASPELERFGFGMEAHEPRRVQAAGAGPVRAASIFAHAADGCVHVEDLVSMTEELVHDLDF